MNIGRLVFLLAFLCLILSCVTYFQVYDVIIDRFRVHKPFTDNVYDRFGGASTSLIDLFVIVLLFVSLLEGVFTGLVVFLKKKSKLLNGLIIISLFSFAAITILRFLPIIYLCHDENGVEGCKGYFAPPIGLWYYSFVAAIILALTGCYIFKKSLSRL